MKELKFLIAYVLMTSPSYFFAKSGLAFSSPMFFMAIRYAISGAILMPFSRKIQLNKDILVLSALTTTSTIFWVYGLVYVSPAQSSVLSYSMPLFSLPIAFLVVREKPSLFETLGIIVGFAGICVYGIPLLGGFTELGMILTIVNAFFWASFTVYYRKMKDMDPVSINSVQFLVGAAIMLLLSPLDFSFTYTNTFLVDLVWMATFGGAFSFIAWNYMIKLSTVNKVTVMAFSVPIFTTVLQAFVSMAIPNILFIIGIILMFAGIYISRLKEGINIVDNGNEVKSI
ncbi:DMT family transporter [Cuniculiplasma sp. SKW3]|uniref:DMT family transporter n=1 Tax=Cuniculiplasma sp. SKW3 TaxID=3400170 RepID=UPI003FCF2332